MDLGDLDKTYKVISKDSYFVEFDNKTEKEKAEDILKLVKKSNLDSSAIRSITFEARKKDLKAFYSLLKEKEYEGKKSSVLYREKYKVSPGDEAIWHHFLGKNTWILGLNIDVKFIRDLLDEQSVGTPTSQGKRNPKVDILGISDYTTLIELKHANTNIFKKSISKGRANTWDFTSDFIEAISQCLGQLDALNKSFENTQYVNNEKKIIDKRIIQNVDPKSVLIIGCRNKEFPVYNAVEENRIKFQTFHRFRRGNRNIEVVTFDELFERAYFTVYNEKLPSNWWELGEGKLFES